MPPALRFICDTSPAGKITSRPPADPAKRSAQGGVIAPLCTRTAKRIDRDEQFAQLGNPVEEMVRQDPGVGAQSAQQLGQYDTLDRAERMITDHDGAAACLQAFHRYPMDFIPDSEDIEHLGEKLIHITGRRQLLIQPVESVQVEYAFHRLLHQRSEAPESTLVQCAGERRKGPRAVLLDMVASRCVLDGAHIQPRLLPQRECSMNFL